eukprot:COSAG05_NODE_23853_length_255_cov_0.666667_1_plen_50_part_10
MQTRVDGLDEAYKRADAYHAAGADAILCHSKKSDDSGEKPPANLLAPAPA